MTSKTTTRAEGWRAILTGDPGRSIGHELNGVDVAEKYSVPLRIRTISNRSATRGRRTLGVTDSRQTRGNFAVAEPPLRAPRLIDRFLWGLWASYLADLSTTGPLFHPDFHFAFEIRGGPRAINPVFRFLESCLKMSFFEREREKEN